MEGGRKVEQEKQNSKLETKQNYHVAAAAWGNGARYALAW